MKKLTFLLLASLFFTGMQAQEPGPAQLRDTTYTYKSRERKALYCTLSDGARLFFNNSLNTAYDASGYFFMTLNRIESDQPALSIPADYVYSGYRASLKNVVIVDGDYQCDFQKITVPDGTEVFCLPAANALTTLNLPATLVHLNFTFSDNLTDLYLRAAYPPYWGEADVSKGLNAPMSQPLTNVTVHVPAMATDLYAQTDPYKSGRLAALEEPVEHLFVGWRPDITIQSTEGLADDARLTVPRWYAATDVSNATGGSSCVLSHNYETAFHEWKSASVQVDYYAADMVHFFPAQLTVDAAKPVKLRKFSLDQDCGEYWFKNYTDPFTETNYKITPSTAIFNSPVTADEIEMTYHMFRSQLRWKGKSAYSSYKEFNDRKYYFVSFPFDVRLSDITLPDLQSDMEVICMEYDGDKRATVTSTNYWRQLSSDEVLHANRGYLMAFFGKVTDAKGTQIYEQTTLRAKAMDTENKQMIFANGDVAVPLTAHPSEYKHRQGWNLIGNPYPCFFDIRHLDFTSPITVYDGFGYYAFSPVDDDYYLYPNEAFFVQCPEGVSSVTFRKEGRLHNDPGGLWQLKPATSQMPSRRQTPGTEAVRRVYNFLLDGEEGFDRTRVVINEQASADYELEYDAAKMTGQGGPQLYVQDGGVQYAIDERPLEDGTFTLGMVFPATGSYVLSLQDNPDEQTSVLLTDLLTGTVTDLTQAAYTFDAAAGTAADRFSVRIGAKMPTPVQCISGTSGEPIYYDLQGRIVTEPSAMQKGVYILKQGQTARKIVK